MPPLPAVITIGVPPEFQLGPLTLAWHGLTIAVGILVGGLLAGREARRRGIDPEPLYTIGIILVAGAIVGSRLFYLAEHGMLDEPDQWIGNSGFTFYGGLIAAALGIVVYVRRSRLSLAYLDLVALGLPLGYGIGRIGDFINGEHYGPASDFFLAVQNTHPDAGVPSNKVAYHSGGFYEMLIGFVTFAVVWPLRNRLPPLGAVWLVMGLMSAGRFVQFFVRSDSETSALGLQTAQWVSVAIITVAVAGAILTRRRLGRGNRPAPAASR